MPASDLLRLPMDSIPFCRSETFWTWLPIFGLRLDRRDCAVFAPDPRVCAAPRGAMRMLTTRLLTKGTGSVPAGRRRPRRGTAAEEHLMMAKQ